MSKDQMDYLRRATEPLGEIYTLNQLPYTQSYEERPDGTVVKGRLREYRGDINRSRFEIKGTIYSGTDMEAEEVDEDTRRAPVNVPDLVIPTSTTNVSRPRTVAAGYYLYVGERAKQYADQRGTVTVIFRDGTFYNYYNVPPGEWQTFKGSISKGPMVNRGTKGKPDGTLLRYPHGPADMSQVPEELQRYVYRIARTEQIKSQKFSQRRRLTVGDKTRVSGTDRFGRRSQRGESYGYVPTSAQKTIKARAGGTNPAANRGRNPNQK